MWRGCEFSVDVGEWGDDGDDDDDSEGEGEGDGDGDDGVQLT